LTEERCVSGLGKHKESGGGKVGGVFLASTNYNIVVDFD